MARDGRIIATGRIGRRGVGGVPPPPGVVGLARAEDGDEDWEGLGLPLVSMLECW